MNTYKLSIPLHTNMDYVRLIMEKWQEAKSLSIDQDVLLVEIADYDDDGLCSHLDDLWCSKSPDGSVGFGDFLQTFGADEPNDSEPTLYYLLNDKQKELFNRIVIEIDEFDEDLTLEETKEVYAALIQDPEVVDIT